MYIIFESLEDPDRTDIPLFDGNELDNFLNENIEGKIGEHVLRCNLIIS
jgi:hypothetical protein